MSDLDTITEVVVVARVEGVQQAKVAVDGLAQSTDRLSAANDDLTTAQAAGAEVTVRQTRLRVRCLEPL